MNKRVRYLILAFLSFFLCYNVSLRLVLSLRFFSDKHSVTPFLPNFLFSLLAVFSTSALTTLVAKFMELKKLSKIFAVSFVVYLLLTLIAQ